MRPAPSSLLPPITRYGDCPRDIDRVDDGVCPRAIPFRINLEKSSGVMTLFIVVHACGSDAIRIL